MEFMREDLVHHLLLQVLQVEYRNFIQVDSHSPMLLI